MAVLLNLLGTPLSQANMGSGEDNWLMAGFCSSNDSDPSALADLVAQLDILSPPDSGEHADHAHTCCCTGATFGPAVISSNSLYEQPQAHAPPRWAVESQTQTPRYLISAPPRASPLS